MTNNYKSEWRADPMGLMQGWPPASVGFLFYVADFEIVDSMQLGIRISCYADDATLVGWHGGRQEAARAELQSRHQSNLLCRP